MSDWTYQGKPFTSDPIDLEPWQGFVYLITHRATGKKYVGKKSFWFSSKKKIKGKKRAKRVEVESDWRDYFGSSNEVATDVEKYGEEAFTREILHLCKTKAECSYLELHEQVVRRALIEPDYYNSWIRVRITRNHLKNLAK